jgi:hypothetical protein
MKGKLTVYRLQVTGIAFTFLLCLLLPSAYSLPPTFAACTTNTRADGLISAKNITGKFGTTALGGACITGSASSFISFKVPTYGELKQVYYDSSKATKTSFASGFPNIADGVYLYTGAGDLTVGGAITGSGTGVIFVPNGLNIDTNITYGSGSTGLVFVVNGNINIASTVTRVDAVLISNGTIYTAGANCNTSSVGPVSALTINGSVVSLNPSFSPKFCRYLSVNTSPAEVINYQPKYLVILRSLLAGQLQIWQELSSAPAAVATAFDYTLTNTGNVNVRQGQSGSSTINLVLTSGATNSQSVNLASSSLPTGVTTSFSPINCYPRCSSTFTLSTSVSTPASPTGTSYPITVTGTPLSRSSQFNLVVYTPPNAPTGLVATPISSSRIDLSWAASTGANTYKVFTCLGNSCNNFTQIGTVTDPTTTFSSTGLNCGNTYRYKVVANNTVGGDSADSNIARADTSNCIYTIASGYSGTPSPGGGPLWYYYWMNYSGASTQATYTTSNMLMKEWFGQPDNNYWTRPGSWMAVDPNQNVGGDNEIAYIYWKAPFKGIANVTVTERRAESSGQGNGFRYGIGYVASVGTASLPSNNPAGQVSDTVANDITSTRTLTKSNQQMLGNGDAIYYYKDSFSWTGGDMSDYTITITFTPN